MSKLRVSESFIQAFMEHRWTGSDEDIEKGCAAMTTGSRLILLEFYGDFFEDEWKKLKKLPRGITEAEAYARTILYKFLAQKGERFVAGLKQEVTKMENVVEQTGYYCISDYFTVGIVAEGMVLYLKKMTGLEID